MSLQSIKSLTEITFFFNRKSLSFKEVVPLSFNDNPLINKLLSRIYVFNLNATSTGIESFPALI